MLSRFQSHSITLHIIIMDEYDCYCCTLSSVAVITFPLTLDHCMIYLPITGQFITDGTESLVENKKINK